MSENLWLGTYNLTETHCGQSGLAFSSETDFGAKMAVL